MCSNNRTTLYNICEIQHSIGETSKHLLFLHAVTGCDTMSATYRQGKRRAFNVVHKQKDYSLMDTFSNAEISKKDVKDAGEQFIFKLYRNSNSKSLNEYRIFAYKEQSGEGLSSSFQLTSLLSTSAAAEQHSYRTYHTVQQWMGNILPPSDWGGRFKMAC